MTTVARLRSILKLLQRLVTEIREVCPPPYCLSVKLNSADYMDKGAGLEQEEGLEQVRWLVECGMVDFVEISGGTAEAKTSGLHSNFDKKTMNKAPTRSESTRIREGFFTDFAEKVQGLNSPTPIQLSGGFRSRTGMADAIDSCVCELVGLGRAAVLEPELPRKCLLNPDYDDSLAFGMSHQVRGLWFGKMFPAKIIGGSFGIQFFYYNMRRLGRGMSSDPDASVALGCWHGYLGDSEQRCHADDAEDSGYAHDWRQSEDGVETGQRSGDLYLMIQALQCANYPR